MDIQEWLHHTTRSPPPLENATTRYAKRDTHRNDTTQKARHRAQSADSSIIRHADQAHGHRRKRKHGSSDTHIERVSSHSAVHQRHRSSSSAPSATTSSSSSTPHNHEDRRFNRTYERRPRHKTKPDKYLPKEKKVEESSNRKDQHKRESKRRKSRKRRKKVSDPDEVVQTFKARNVVNDRLTVRDPLLAQTLYVR